MMGVISVAEDRWTRCYRMHRVNLNRTLVGSMEAGA
jgi:hypothetical protein